MTQLPQCSLEDGRVLEVGFFRPNADLHFADVSLAEHPFGNSIDADAAANRVHIIFFLNTLVIVKILGLVPRALDL